MSIFKINSSRLFTSIILILSSTSLFGQEVSAWTGEADSDWGNADNWAAGTVPTPDDDVVIPSTANNPILDADRCVGKITIENSAEFRLESWNFTLLGDWVNNGTVDAGTSNVIFNGSSLQKIYGNQTFNNLIIQNINGVTISSGIDSLKGILTLTSGSFSTNDSFVIYSDSVSTGSIGPITEGSIHGEITMLRYINIGSSNWRYLSSPVSNATLLDLDDDFWTTGFSGSTYPSDPFISVFTYDETISGDFNNGYIGASSINDTLIAGEGIMLYMGSSSATEVFDISGIPNTGLFNIPLTYTLSDTISDGWNFIGNPYPSAIDWDSPSITSDGLENAIYIWNPALQAYSSYVDGLGTNGGSNIIPSSQSFWVKANTTDPTLQFTENSKSSNSGIFLKSCENSLGLVVSVENVNGSDETILNSNFSATTNFDASYDAAKMFSTAYGVPIIFTSISGGTENYSINQFPEQEITIPLSIYTSTGGDHLISISGLESFPNVSCIYLEDTYTNQSYNINDSAAILIYLYDTTSTPRFLLKFGAPTFAEGHNVTCYGDNDGHINFGKDSDSLFDITWHNGWGGVIAEENDVFEITWLDDLSPGLYVVESSDHLCGIRMDSIYINQPPQISAQFSMSQDTILLPINSAEVIFTNESLNANYYNWKIDGLDMSSLTSPNFLFQNTGTSTIELTSYQSSDCFEQFAQDVIVLSSLSIETSLDDLFQVILNNQGLLISVDHADLIEIRNTNGQLLYRKKEVTDQVSIDLSDIAHQVLLITVFDANRAVTKKMMKE
jgi:hypothetical protein